MLFEIDKQYKYIRTLEKTVDFLYVVFIIVGAIIGSTTSRRNAGGLILGAISGFLIAGVCTLKLKIQIQKMKWEIDIHNKITKN